MADAERIRSVYERYPELVSAGDVDAIVDLYAEDATIEDPIGSDLHRGRDAIRKFYAASAGHVTMKQTGPVRIAGHEAATPFVILMGPEGERRALDVISTMTFDDEAKVQTMRAFWSFEAMRPATEAD